MVVCHRRVPKASASSKGPSLARGFYSDISGNTTDSDEEGTQSSLSSLQGVQTREDIMAMDIESAEESWSDSDKESSASFAGDSSSILLDAPYTADYEQNDAAGGNPIPDCEFSDSGNYSAGYASDHSGDSSHYELEESEIESASESDSMQGIITCSQWSQDEDEAMIQALVAGPNKKDPYAITIEEVDCLFVASVWAHVEPGAQTKTIN
ncbi:hypothetical protein THARTR1_06373 [Trichoderma harzianum]|uniref:Uncharacterized protein n=1 Tax=Trichoderma harzianum TaxID=5544 RepID=A0A2K0U5W0_TRIHA|nr:hypothetical protein THARTR1_06373 [Trichoderma harzianum]